MAFCKTDLPNIALIDFGLVYFAY